MTSENLHRREPKPATVGILLFPDVEVLDFAGPFEVFSVASRIAEFQHPPFEVMTIAAAALPVTARHGLQIVAGHGFEDAPPIDILIVPGGIVAQPLADPVTLNWLRTTAQGAAITASVCTGAFLLAKVGLLDGLTATTHWEDIPEMRATFPKVALTEDVPYVDHGKIITSAGISAGIGMSLHLVERWAGAELARRTARQMQYDWNPI